MNRQRHQISKTTHFVWSADDGKRVRRGRVAVRVSDDHITFARLSGGKPPAAIGLWLECIDYATDDWRRSKVSEHAKHLHANRGTRFRVERIEHESGAVTYRLRELRDADLNDVPVVSRLTITSGRLLEDFSMPLKDLFPLVEAAKEDFPHEPLPDLPDSFAFLGQSGKEEVILEEDPPFADSEWKIGSGKTPFPSIWSAPSELDARVHFTWTLTDRSGEQRGRVVVRVKDGKIIFKRLAGRLPPAELNAWREAINAAVRDEDGYSVGDHAKHWHAKRQIPFAIKKRVGMSGCRRFSLCQLRNQTLRDAPVVARLEISANHRLHDFELSLADYEALFEYANEDDHNHFLYPVSWCTGEVYQFELSIQPAEQIPLDELEEPPSDDTAFA